MGPQIPQCQLVKHQLYGGCADLRPDFGANRHLDRRPDQLDLGAERWADQHTNLGAERWADQHTNFVAELRPDRSTDSGADRLNLQPNHCPDVCFDYVQLEHDQLEHDQLERDASA